VEDIEESAKIVDSTDKPQIEKTELTQTTQKPPRKYAVRGLEWTPEDEAELLKQYDRLISEGRKYGVTEQLAKLPQFKGRSTVAITIKLKKLRANRKVQHSPETIKKHILWSNSEADDFIVELWNSKVTYDAITESVKEKFPGKHICVDYRIELLRKTGRIQPRRKTAAANVPEKKEQQKIIAVAAADDVDEKGNLTPGGLQETLPEEIVNNFEKYVDRRLDSLIAELNTLKNILKEDYDPLGNILIELREDFYAYTKMQGEIVQAQREDLKVLTAKCEQLQKKLALHKHDAFSGEATLRMEA